MDGIEDSKEPEQSKPRTKDGKIINKLIGGDQQDSN
jgi:hypothetical protein